MADLDSEFREYYPPTDQQRKSAITEGLVSLDANVLLDAYRFNPQAREELFNALEKLGDRLWISHQVALEFHKNRIIVIGGQSGAYAAALKALMDFHKHFEDSVHPKLNKLGNTVALTNGEQATIVDPLIKGIKQTVAAIRDLQERHGVSLGMVSKDQVLHRLQGLLKGKVGDPLSPEKEKEARKEAKRRVEEKIPPGYADSEKIDPAGDYLLWYQTLEEAKRRKQPILFVTRDVKEDWFRREKGQTISARPELIREAKEIADTPLIIMETQTFLRNAREYLHAVVSDELLSQVGNLPEVSSTEESETAPTIRLSRGSLRAIEQNIALLIGKLEIEQAEMDRDKEALREFAINPHISRMERREFEEQLHRTRVKSENLYRKLETARRAQLAIRRPLHEGRTGFDFRSHEWHTIRSAMGALGLGDLSSNDGRLMPD
ncbi:PIN-like domain-containing protein [Streptosporangium soli]|nr:PIN domain-containing protein [Streptosporangium sp. KLBMP 9127]